MVSKLPKNSWKRQVIEVCLQFIKESNDRSTKLLDFYQPSEMKKRFDFTIPEQGVSIEQLIKDCAETLKYSVKTGEKGKEAFAGTSAPRKDLEGKDLLAPLLYEEILDRITLRFWLTHHNDYHLIYEYLSNALTFIKESNDRSTKLLDFYQPSEMKKRFDFTIPEQGVSIEQLIKDCAETLKYSVKTGHPHYFNQLSCGLDTVSLAGEWLTAAANTNMFTYEIAPVFILMEQYVLEKMRRIIGYDGGDSILCPGGSISNLYAVLCARYKKFPEVKTKGMKAIPTLVAYTSEHSHYSLPGALASGGIGTDNCVDIRTDENGSMDPEHLEAEVLKAKAAGKVPFFVNCTAGTTVVGAFDPIEPIHKICQKYGMWLHVDAAWGGGLLLTPKYREQRFRGIHLADSVTWNPHKLMTSLLQCSTVHFKEEGLLFGCNQMCADYLFQQDKHYDVSFDTGDKVIQCGRHNDIFKLWLMWRSKGMEGYAKQMDHLMEMSEYLVEQMKARPDMFHLIYPKPQCVNVCFWYVPKRLRGQPKTREWMEELGKITPRMKGEMMYRGTLMISYQPLGDLPNFFRNIISNPGVQKEDVDFLVAELDRIGADM
ncbi:unnamed protein product [Cyprideis torosa]|uniref:Uncharacterized protein n=1 Tax=Cyprideis torosa TaxID=163714 RepID=A0A7R8W3L2_9CRUS|nr:unnamed protein product [Cyprideis torosa]CAG0880981.1 unnamed protein product [Cyprideis torosa]